MYCTQLAPGISACQVGAKAANLGVVLSKGICVPKGFVVIRDALTLFLNETGLHSQICEFLAEGDSDRAIRKQAYEELCAEVIRMPMPEMLQEEVTQFALPLLQSALLHSTATSGHGRNGDDTNPKISSLCVPLGYASVISTGTVTKQQERTGLFATISQTATHVLDG
jgi:hypothetical protein